MRQTVKCIVWAGIVACLAWQVHPHDSPLIRGLATLLQAQQVVAKSDGVTVSQTELDLALQQHLWRRGEILEALPSAAQAKARSVVIQRLVEQRLVREERSREQVRPAYLDLQNELSRFARMLGFEDGRRVAALKAGLHNEVSFEQSIHESLLDEHWLNRKLFSAPPSFQILDWYQAHRDQLRLPTAYHAAHLFLSSHERNKPNRSAEIQQLAAQLASGAVWSALVGERSEDERTRHREGDLGWFTTNRMPAEIMTAVQQLRAGQLSAPIETPLGWHIIKLIEIKPSRMPQLAEVKEEISAMLGNRPREQLGSEVLEQLRQGQTPPDLGLPLE